MVFNVRFKERLAEQNIASTEQLVSAARCQTAKRETSVTVPQPMRVINPMLAFAARQNRPRSALKCPTTMATRSASTEVLAKLIRKLSVIPSRRGSQPAVKETYTILFNESATLDVNVWKVSVDRFANSVIP